MLITDDSTIAWKSTVGSASHTGLRRRRNEDSHYVGTTTSGVTVLAVADGLGGHPHGDIASRKAVEWFVSDVESLSCVDADNVYWERELVDIVDHLQRLFSHKIRLHPEMAGMGTTLTAVLIYGATAHVVHVGDSRCFLLHNRQLSQLTTDHTFIEQVRQAGVNTDGLTNSKMLHALWNCLGPQITASPEISHCSLAAGDKLLLCSDGVTNMVDNTVIQKTLASNRKPQQIANELIDAANKRGGVDNSTAVVHHYH